MFETLFSLEKYPRKDLYFHNVFAGDRREIIQKLRDGNPLFCLRGRASLKRESPIFQGTSLVFFIPASEAVNIVEPIYLSPFEFDDNKKCPSFYTFVKQLPPEYINDAERWIRSQQEIAGRPEFLSASVEDVRVLPSKYFLGES